MSECHLCGHEYGSAWSICVRCYAKKTEDDLVKAAARVAEGPVRGVAAWLPKTAAGKFDLAIEVNGQDGLIKVNRQETCQHQYSLTVNADGAPSYSIKMLIPDADPETCAPRQIQISDTKPTEAPCRTCAKSNDLGVKVCWCCGNAP